MTEEWKYKGPIFDAHTHIGHSDDLVQMVKIEEEFNVASQVAIVHGEGNLKPIKKQFPNRFVFAKYLSLSDIANFEVDRVIAVIERIKPEGYGLAKMWFGPRWRDYYQEVPDDFRIDDLRLDPIFRALEDHGVPLLLHVADPDTYYELHYQDKKKYGTKADSLVQLENVIERHPRLVFQLPHFGSQPEIHHLSNLAKWLDRFPNIMLDTASSRWMARELSKNVDMARRFLVKYSDRIMFGTDLSTNRGGQDYFTGRYLAQRLLWETNVRERPLPFDDADTKDTGGTFINGLDLPVSVLSKLYWENAVRFHGVPD
ncbi:MAG: amidohydrolase family protein [Candidatus Thorarchaeota archaeon]